MHLGIYRFDGDPEELLAAYDKLMAGMPPGQAIFHACVTRPDGVTVYDACPDEAAFRRWVGNPGLQDAFAGAGLPSPEITDAPVHNALVDGRPFSPAASG
ncbi:MAG TPA: hypothetical protein VIU81_01940 [Gaiellaceae bacterium]